MNGHETATTFDEHAAVYDLLIDWPRRLGNEEPFYRRLFAQAAVSRVLDAACGTGHHAAMFREWGLEVEGADISPGMIAQARARHGEPPGLRWVVRGYDRPASPAGSFDAVICMGNSLALADDEAVMERAVRAMLESLRPGGICIVGVLNLWSLPENTTVWQKCKRVEYGGGEHILLKSVRRCGDHGYIDFADLDLSGGGLAPRYDAARFFGLTAEWLTRAAEAAGAASPECHGSHRFEPYSRDRSTDLLFTCRKA